MRASITEIVSIIIRPKYHHGDLVFVDINEYVKDESIVDNHLNYRQAIVCSEGIWCEAGNLSNFSGPAGYVYRCRIDNRDYKLHELEIHRACK